MIKIVNSLFQENTYLIKTDNDLCYVIDPGSDYNNIVKKIDENFKGVKAILLTHGHFDHFMSSEKIANKYCLKFICQMKISKLQVERKALLAHQLKIKIIYY